MILNLLNAKIAKRFNIRKSCCWAKTNFFFFKLQNYVKYYYKLICKVFSWFHPINKSEFNSDLIINLMFTHFINYMKIKWYSKDNINASIKTDKLKDVNFVQFWKDLNGSLK